MEQSHDLLTNDLTISESSHASLVIIAKWGKFLAITGFVFCGLMIVAGISISAFAPSVEAYNYGSNQFLKYIGIIYFVLAIVYFFPFLFLLKFSNKTQEALRSANQESLDMGFMNLKSLFKFCGVLTIVMLIITVLAFLGGIMTSLMR